LFSNLIQQQPNRSPRLVISTFLSAGSVLRTQFQSSRQLTSFSQDDNRKIVLPFSCQNRFTIIALQEKIIRQFVLSEHFYSCNPEFMTSNPFSQPLVSVGELTRTIRVLLETSLPFVRVVGEISNLRQPLSGHLYFTLKDNEAQVRAVFFKMQQRFSSLRPMEGMQVICRGKISVYEARGEYQLIVDSVEKFGAGMLQQQFEMLKKRLAEEGLFDSQHKKKIPLFPSRIAVITSPSGAAIHDFLKTAHNRFPGFPIVMVPVRVQGPEAAAEICEALEIINEKNLADVIVLCRGGGSIEDLWAFNEEKVARSIYNSDIPVATGIGHETDFTISDFVADYRAVTPTAAAEASVPDRKALEETVGRCRKNIRKTIEGFLEDSSQKLASLKRHLHEPRILSQYLLKLDNLQERQFHSIRYLLHRKSSKFEKLRHHLVRHHPETELTGQQLRLSFAGQRLNAVISYFLALRTERLEKSTLVLQATNPKAILKRGYAIVTNRENQIIRRAASTVAGEQLSVQFHQGRIKVSVLRTDGKG
jgi:exodeoxyribonuclease VII large subunit